MLNTPLTADKADMFKLGQKYAEAGIVLTPQSCKPIDDFIFSHTKGMQTLDRIKVYNELRGSFNRGWNKTAASI